MHSHGLAVLGLLGGLLCGCYTWEVSDTAPEQVIAQREPSRVQIKMNDGQEFVLLNPQVEGDSLSGEIMPDDAVGAGRSYRPTIPVVVSLEDVRTLAVQRPTEIPWVLQGAVLVGVVAVAVAVGLK